MKIGIRGVVALCLSMPFGMMPGQPQGHDEHKQLAWRSVGGCVVDFVNTPCRTVRYHEYSFGSSLGFDRTARSEAVEATDHTGSESKTRTSTWRGWWCLSQKTSKTTELLLRAADKIVYIDHEHKVYEAHPGAAKRGWPYWEEDDAQCRQQHPIFFDGADP